MKLTRCILYILIYFLSTVCYSDSIESLRNIRAEKFLKSVEGADRIVVRKGGMDCCGSVKDNPILFTVNDASAVKNVRAHLNFLPGKGMQCLCCGFPGIDWYKGKKRLALTALKHGQAIWQKGDRCTLQLTKKSQKWIINWLAKNGVKGPKKEHERRKRLVVIYDKAQKLMKKFIPKGFAQAVNFADKEMKSKGIDVLSDNYASEKFKIRNKYFRKLFADSGQMYLAFFRLLGCLTMHWNSRYREQDEVYGFLVKAPKQELEKAFNAAAASNDPILKKGAARLIYAQYYMTLYQKNNADLTRWMSLFVNEAYSDPFPENRRIVLSRLIEYPNVKAFDVLKMAVEYPDKTVRMRAIKALSLRPDSYSLNILKLIANGKKKVYKRPKVMLINYGQAARNFTAPEMCEDKTSESERDAALKALKYIISKK